MSDSLYGRHLYVNIGIAFGSFKDGEYEGQLSTDDAGNEYRWLNGAWLQVALLGAILASLATLIAGENNQDSLANGYLATRGKRQYTVVTFTGTTDIAIGTDGASVMLKELRVLTSPTANMLIAKGTVASNAVVETVASTVSAGDKFEYHDAIFSTGLVLDPEAGTDGSYLVIWSYT